MIFAWGSLWFRVGWYWSLGLGRVRFDGFPGGEFRFLPRGIAVAGARRWSGDAADWLGYPKPEAGVGAKRTRSVVAQALKNRSTLTV
jgi:hypothetical protein